MLRWQWILIYYFCLTLITFFLFYADKRKARKHKYRISEKTLLCGILLGGFVGSALAMIWIHHKNRKKKFLFLTLLSFLLHGIFWIKLLR